VAGLVIWSNKLPSLLGPGPTNSIPLAPINPSGLPPSLHPSLSRSLSIHPQLPPSYLSTLNLSFKFQLIITMTKKNVLVPELSNGGVSVAAAVAATISYPPPRGGGAGGMTMKKKFVTAQLELSGARVNGWVESMKASSPTHAKAAVGLSSPSLSLEEYSANWVVCVWRIAILLLLCIYFSFYFFNVMESKKMIFCCSFFIESAPIGTF
jgi:hypothetical protein